MGLNETDEMFVISTYLHILKSKFLISFTKICSTPSVFFYLSYFYFARLPMHLFYIKYLSLYISKKYNNWILIKYSLRGIKQDPTWLYFFLIYWEKSKRLSLIVNNVKILNEKDKKIQREYVDSVPIHFWGF